MSRCTYCRLSGRACLGADCDFRALFPAHRYVAVERAIRSFTPADIERKIYNVAVEDRQAVARSVLYEAYLRHLDPLDGSIRLIQRLLDLILDLHSVNGVDVDPDRILGILHGDI